MTTAITYTYDGLQRLIEADYSTSEKFEYAYDAVGNRTIYTVPKSRAMATTLRTGLPMSGAWLILGTTGAACWMTRASEST